MSTSGITARRLGLAVSSILQPLAACKPRRRVQGHDHTRHASGHREMRLNKTRLPPGGHERMPASKPASPDAFAGDGDKEPVKASRRVDVLAMERSHKRISEPAYRAGQIVQATFGRLSGCECDTGAETIRKMVAAIQDRIGMLDTRLLHRILIDRMSFTECAALQGKSGDRGHNYVAHRFRDALEDLAGTWTNEMVALAAKISALP